MQRPAADCPAGDKPGARIRRTCRGSSGAQPSVSIIRASSWVRSRGGSLPPAPGLAIGDRSSNLGGDRLMEIHAQSVLHDGTQNSYEQGCQPLNSVVQ